MRLITEQDYSIAESARNLGLNAQLLSRWVREYRELPGEAFRGNGNLTPEQEEIRSLKEENERCNDHLNLQRYSLRKKQNKMFVYHPT